MMTNTTAHPYQCKTCGHQTWNLGGRRRHEAESGHRAGWAETPAKPENPLISGPPRDPSDWIRQPD